MDAPPDLSAQAEELRRRGLERLGEGALADALELVRRAAALAPAVAANHTALGRVLEALGRSRAALAAHAIAVGLAPEDGEVLYRCGTAHQRAGRAAEAERFFRRALATGAAPDAGPEALARLLFESGRVEEAVALLRALIAVGRATPVAEDMHLFFLHFLPETTRDRLRTEHAAWHDRQAGCWPSPGPAPTNDRSPERRLRVGYVSADFREHPVMQAVWPLLAGHDRQDWEVIAYSGGRVADAMTARCREACAAWRDCAAWTDEQFAQQVRDDRIDLLVDLSLHTTGHRLAAFARRLAPVQVTWAGYPGTTGLAAMDYRLTDVHLDPAGWGERAGPESPVRLPESFWCYAPIDEHPAVNPLPALAEGTVTFGCLNKSAKVNAPTVALWARVLEAVPRARMLVRATNDLSRENIARLFQTEGIDAARIEFVGWHPHREYLALHHRIDVALDPIPYGGHVTLLDGLWMGVPTVVWPGETPVARAGLSILTTAGLPDWVAQSADDFVRIAGEQTRDLTRLAALRVGLRERLRSSALMDGRRFARGVEAAYREMWRRWCGAVGERP